MLSLQNIFDTIAMVDKQHLDIRTITMGISLLDCADEDMDRCCDKIYDKICSHAEKLVRTGCDIESEFGIPIVNKRISVTPIAIAGAACKSEDFVPLALTLDRAAKTCGVNFIGGYSALVQKGFTSGDRRLIASIPEALARTELVCSSVNVGSTKAGINMDAVARMGRIIKETAHLTRDKDGLGCAKLVVFCNAVEDNPFMAGAFHGVGEADSVINVGVSGPGVVRAAIKKAKDTDNITEIADIIKKTAFKITRMGQLVAFAEALLHQRGIAAQKVHAAGLARPVKGQGEGDVVLRVAAARHQRHGGDGDALVDDGDTEFAFDIPARLHQLFRPAADFVVNFVAAALGILADAVQQGDAHGDGADVQMLLVDHVDGVKNVLQIQHGSASAYSLCMASKMSSR